MGQSTILPVIHTITIGTMRNNNGGNNGHVAYKQTFSESVTDHVKQHTIFVMFFNEVLAVTKMHSSRVSTARLLTVSHSIRCGGHIQGDVCQPSSLDKDPPWM